MNDTLEAIRAFSGPIVVLICGMIVLLMDLGGKTNRRRRLAEVSIFGFAFAAILFVPGLAASTGLNKLVAPDMKPPILYFGEGMVVDGIGSLLGILLSIVGILVVGLSGRYLTEKKLPQGEFYALVQFATAGAMILAQSFDLVNVFVGLELLSVALYILAGYARRELRSEESAVKYFLLGAFASGFLLYGIALVYGAVGIAVQKAQLTEITGHYTNFYTIAETIRETSHTATPLLHSPLFVAGIALMLVGLCFKASIVPFHMYAPDVYQGAPAPVTAFMSSAAKIGAFATMIRVLQPFLLVPESENLFRNVLWGLGLATMIVGNVLAIRQTNLKRMLAYSSVAHAGYILVGVLASCVGKIGLASNVGAEAVVFYLLAYSLMNIGTFAVIVWLGHDGGERAEIRDYVGLYHRHPVAAVVLAVLLFSLAGLPLTAGFLGKLYLFYAATNAGLYRLVAFGLLVSVIGAVYYLNVVVQMFFKQPLGDANPEVRAGGAKTVAILCALATILLGIVPSGILGPTEIFKASSPRKAAALPAPTTPLGTPPPNARMAR